MEGTATRQRQQSPQAQAAALFEQRAIKQRQARASAPATKTLRRNRQPNVNTMQVEVPESSEMLMDSPTESFEPSSEIARQESLNADRARAASNNASMGVMPGVQNLADSGHINEEQMQQANARIAEITQQMRQATTYAQIQTLASEYRALNEELEESALEHLSNELAEEFRDMLWRFASNGSLFADAASVGTDGFLGSIASNVIQNFRVWYGRFVGSGPEPERLKKVYIPPPLRLTPERDKPGALGVYERVKVLYDLLVYVITATVGNGLVVFIGLLAVILLGSIARCTSLGVSAAVNDEMCQALGHVVAAGATGGVSEILLRATGN